MSKVPAADHTLRILTMLARARGPLPAAHIAAQLGIARSSAYHLLSVMAGQGFVTHFPEDRRWGLGAAAFELSSGFSRQQPLTRLGQPLIERLVDQLGESGHLAVLQGTDVLYLAEARAPRRPSLVSNVGVRLPAHLTATGRALLAALPAAQLRALYPSGTSLGGEWSYARLKAVLQQVQRDGVAVEDGEVTDGLASVGAVVRDAIGWPSAAVALTFSREVPDAERRRLAEAVQSTAAQLERRLHPAHPPSGSGAPAQGEGVRAATRA